MVTATATGIYSRALRSVCVRATDCLVLSMRVPLISSLVGLQCALAAVVPIVVAESEFVGSRFGLDSDALDKVCPCGTGSAIVRRPRGVSTRLCVRRWS